MKKRFNFILGITICAMLAQMPALASVSSWSDLNKEADTASEGATISVANDLNADGSSIGFLQKQLTLDVSGYTIKGAIYQDDSPLVFSGAGASETAIAIMNATFTDFDTQSGIIRSSNPKLILTDVSFVNNKGTAVNNEGYNGLVINAKNSDVNFKNNATYGIKSNSNVYLNAYDGKTITLDDAISIDNNFDGNLVINNTFKEKTDLNGTVILNKNIDFASSNGMITLGAKSSYKNGTLKLGVEPANSNDFRLSVGGEATLDMQNDNVDNLTMSRFSGDSDSPLHLKLDYDASTGKMDLIVVSDSAVGASTPSIIVDEIKILVDGDATSTKYLDGLGKTVIEVSSDIVSAIKDNKTYIFTPVTNDRGAYTVKRATNITNLPEYIQNEPDPLFGNDVAITSDITLTEDLGTLVGDGRETNVFGNGHYIDGNGHEGVTVKDGQTFGFTDITLKNFPTKNLIKNEGTTNLTKATLENVSIVNDKLLNLNSTILNDTNITNNAINKNFTNKDGGIVLTGENILKSGSINASGSNNGEIFVDSGTTTVENGFTINTLALTVGQEAGSTSSATLVNSGEIETDNFYLNQANLHNTGTITINGVMQDLHSVVANVINDGTISSNLGYYIGDKSTFKNNAGATLSSGGHIENAGKLINEVTINSNVQNFWANGLGSYSYGELTSNLDDITGSIYQVGNDNDGSIFNITGGTITDSKKIQNYPDQSGGIINILGTVKSLVRLDNFDGKTFVKNGGEVQVVGSETSRIFTTGDITFEDGSTLNLRESTIPAGRRFEPNNLILAENDTLNLKMKDGLTLYTPRKTAKGKFSLKELEISASSNNWQLIDDANNSDIYGRTSLDSDLKLIKNTSSASGVNSVMYNKFTGKISYGTKDLQGALDEVNFDAMSNYKGSDYFYELNGEEEAIGGFSSGSFIVNGSNNGVIKIPQ